MQAAQSFRRDPARDRLLVIDGGRGELRDALAADLPALLAPGDLLVVNDAATLPAMLRAEGGRELRLLAWRGGPRWWAVQMGAGDWRQDTDLRPAPPAARPGDRLRFPGGLTAEIEGVAEISGRLLLVRFDRADEALWAALYALGRPVQYSYLREEVPLWAVQNVYAARPWAVEMPSAGRALTWGLLARLRERGVGLARLTHAAGLSATGDPALDAALPLPERYSIPGPTAAAVAAAKAAGKRVIAAGTSVVRALEGDRLVGGPGEGATALRIGPGFVPAVVDGVLSNMHAPGESHFALLAAFAGPALLREAAEHAAAAGYLAHEFGDVSLVLR